VDPATDPSVAEAGPAALLLAWPFGFRTFFGTFE